MIVKKAAVCLLMMGLTLRVAFAQPAFDVAGAPVSIQILAQSRSAPENALHGSLLETNEKLKGLLDRVRKPDLFRGELGETLLIEPFAGLLPAADAIGG